MFIKHIRYDFGLLLISYHIKLIYSKYNCSSLSVAASGDWLQHIGGPWQLNIDATPLLGDITSLGSTGEEWLFAATHP